MTTGKLFSLRSLKIISSFVGDGAPAGDPPAEETVSKADHDKAISEWTTKYADLQKEIETLSKSSSFTAEERERLENALKDVRTQKETTEHTLRAQIEKSSKVHAAELDKLSTESNQWKARFEQSTIHRDITDAAVANKAYVPGQLVAMLQSQVRLAEVLDDAGKPTGKYESRITYTETDKAGKTVNLDLTVPEAIAKMKGDDRYFNLFDSGQRSGAGMRGSQGSAITAEQAALLSPEEYRAWRKQTSK